MNEIFFKDVQVPVENLVGQENNGWPILMQALSFERGFAIVAASRCKRAFDELLVFSKETGSFKRPEIRKQFVELAIEIRALRVLALEEIWKESKQEYLGLTS